MCGRYSLNASSQFVENQLQNNSLDVYSTINEARSHESTNLGPASYGLVYRHNDDGKHVLEYMKWGLVPFFAKEPLKYSTFNVRSDSLAELKPTWRNAKTKRAIAIMEGYYEWQHGVKERIPYYIHRKDKQLMCALAIWDSNSHLEDGELHSYSIVTTDASPDLAKIHPRMPCFVDFEQAHKWIDGEWPDVLSLIKSTQGLEAYQVGIEVNKVGNQGEHLNKPLKGAPKGVALARGQKTIASMFQAKPKQETKQVPKHELKQEPKQEPKTESKDHQDQRPPDKASQDQHGKSSGTGPAVKHQQTVHDESLDSEPQRKKIKEE